jgi:tol-pal system protein YbgF
VNNTNTTVTVLDSHLQDALKDQQQQISTPVVTVGTKVDAMSQEFRFVRESIADLNSRVGKLQAQIADLKTTMQIMSAPPPPPAADGQTPPPSAAIVPPGAAAKLYSDALRDQSGGKLDLALMEYQDFLRLYPNSDLAPAAQFGLGEVYFAKNDYEASQKSFDLLLEKYPENEKTPDAMFMKAKSLVELDQKRSAAREYRALIQKYPDVALAARAREELAALGY